jgi:protein tyrosine/serine phosphatase
MQTIPNGHRALVAAVILALSVCVFAETPRREKLAAIQIKNFGCINDNYFRGAQPQERDYAALAALGVKTVIDLEEEGESKEAQQVEAAGMKFYRIKMNTKDKPNQEQVGTFLKIVDDPTNQPVYVHCHGGRHRTGVMTAVYRMTHNSWSADQAFTEMKQFQFEKGMVSHGTLKDFVYEYHAGLGKQKSTGKSDRVIVATPNP